MGRGGKGGTWGGRWEAGGRWDGGEGGKGEGGGGGLLHLHSLYLRLQNEEDQMWAFRATKEVPSIIVIDDFTSGLFPLLKQNKNGNSTESLESHGSVNSVRR